MSVGQLQHALGAVSPAQVSSFFLVLARITPLFILAPVFSSKMIIREARVVLALALALGLSTAAGHHAPVPTDVLALVGLLLVNALVGFALAFAIACVLGAVNSAGVLADSFSGFSFGSQVDPLYGNPGGTLSTLYSLIGVALFLAIGGDAWTLRGISATFTAVPITAPLSVAAMHGMIGGAVAAVGIVFLGAVEVAAPVMLATVIADASFGLVSRVAPQLNVYAVGFPVKVGVALLVVGVSLPFLAGWMSNQLQDAVTSVMTTI